MEYSETVIEAITTLTVNKLRTGLAVLAALRDAAKETFWWRTEEYEFVRDPIAVDLLFGSDRERTALESGTDWHALTAAWEPEEAEFRDRRREHLLYP